MQKSVIALAAVVSISLGCLPKGADAQMGDLKERIKEVTEEKIEEAIDSGERVDAPKRFKKKAAKKKWVQDTVRDKLDDAGKAKREKIEKEL